MGLETNKDDLKPGCNPPRIAKDECNDLIASNSPAKKRKTYTCDNTSPTVTISVSQLDAAAAYRVDNADKRATMVTAIRNLCKAFDATGGNSADILGMTEHEFLHPIL